MIGTRKGGYRRSPGGGSMNKKNPSGGGGGVSPMGVFFMWAVFSLNVRGGHAIFSVCGGGGDLFFRMGGGGIIGLAPPPITIFAGASCHKKSFQIVEVLIFFEGAIRSTQKTCPPPPQHQFK